MRFFRRIPDIVKGVVLYVALAVTALMVFFVAEQYIPYQAPQPAPVAQAAPAPRIVLPEPVEPYTPPVMFEEKRAGFIVKVVLENGHGSGVHIGNGLVLTNYHVAGKLKEVTLKSDDGDIQKAEVLWGNDSRDVALVLASHPERLSAAELSCRDLVNDELLTSYGNPTNIEFITIKGRVAGKARELGAFKNVVPVDMTIIPGMSGGPVLDGEGRLIGLNVGVMPVYVGITASLSGIGYIIPSSTICQLLGRV